MQWGGNRRPPARLGGHQERPVFCLIVLGDARGHETGKQGNRPANPRQEKLPIIRTMGSGRIDTEVCDVTAGASSPAIHGNNRPRSSKLSVARKQARFVRYAATFNVSRRSATTTAAASSSAAIAFDWTWSQRLRRLDDHDMTGWPAASRAIRSGNRASIARRRSAVAPPHSPISARVRPHPMQSAARSSSAQTATQGD